LNAGDRVDWVVKICDGELVAVIKKKKALLALRAITKILRVRKDSGSLKLVKKKGTIKKTRNKVRAGLQVAKKITREKIRDTKPIIGERIEDSVIPGLLKMSKKYGFKADINKNYGFGPIDLVWNIKFHPILEPLRRGFVKLREEEEGGSSDLNDGQFSLRKIEEAIMLGLRSGMDRVYLLCDTEDIAKSVTGQIEWLSTFGSFIRLDSYAATVFPGQRGQTKIFRSQKRVPQRKKAK
jgi:hypothetical protein